MAKKKTADMLLLGEDASPDQIRRFLNKIPLSQCTNEKGEYYSPLTGEIFDSFYQLAGHIGARLRGPRTLSEMTDDRAGYMKAVRRGLEPTEAQRQANRDYIREVRRKARSGVEQ